MSQRSSKLSNKNDELDFFFFFNELEQLYSTIGKQEKLEISCIIHMEQMHMRL